MMKYLHKNYSVQFSSWHYFELALTARNSEEADGVVLMYFHSNMMNLSLVQTYAHFDLSYFLVHLRQHHPLLFQVRGSYCIVEIILVFCC